MASSSERKRIPHVFLSFDGTGTDVRQKIVSPLRSALNREGITTSIDSEELEKGEHISPAPAEVIEESPIAIIIFSEDFASSTGCLEEVAKIMECKEQRDLRVFPVFYEVDPRGVRELDIYGYKEAIDEHEFKFGKHSKEVKRWKKALFDASSLSGWDLPIYGRQAFELIKGIVEEISSYLNRKTLRVAEIPVGIDSRVAELKPMLNLESDDDVVMVGLWGQPGIGKTALARALYNAIFRQFEGACFLANVREASKDSKDLVLLQEKLLSKILSLQHRLEVSSVDRGINLIRGRLCHKKVLLVLDDVDDLRQLNASAGKGNWFGNGSKIIVTTRDKHLLTRHGIDQDHVYEVKALDDIEACQLLRFYASRRHRFEIKKDLMDRVMNYTRGIPLELEVLGSLLCGRRENEWESTLDELFGIPNKTIDDVIRRSFDELGENEKEILLHIACFFNGWDSNYVMKVLQNCNFGAEELYVLIERSFISIDEDGLIRVPELIQLMGMDIVRQQCLDDPGRRSRLWLYDDVVHVLSRDMEDCAVIAIVLEPPEPTKIRIGPNAFTKMSTLRLLIVRNVHNSFQDAIYLPNELRWFEWAGWAPTIPEFCSNTKELVELDISKCGISVVPQQSTTSVASIEHVIGIHHQVKDVIKSLQIEDDKVRVRIVGIHGTNGMGKTTIAKAVYDRLSSYFDSCSFLEEIGETARSGGGIQFVQTKLISDILKRDDVDVASFEGGIEFFLDVFRSIKVLVVLDDVEDESHLNDLVGDKLGWFGPGSRIIVTSEDGETLQEYVSRGLAHTCEVEGMDIDRARELLWKHASAIDSSIPDYLESKKRIIEATTDEYPFVIRYTDEYLETAKRIVEATRRVPFVIEVIGTFLRGKQVVDWWKLEDSIKPQNKNSGERLKDCREILGICYEALHDKQKEIFWDVVWFANGVDSRIASYMWPGQDLLSSHHVLMPLAKIGGDNMLWMHKMLKRLSRTVHQAETNYPGSRCRRYMNVTDMEEFKKKEGKEEVEALCFDFTTPHLHTFTETNFKSMPNIRFLKLDRASMTGNFANVFPKLRWLRWQGCPRDFEATEFNLTELVILDLSWSKVTEDWGGWRKIKMKRLKVLNLTGCADLLISPPFSCFPNLEILILERCSRLVYLDPSVGSLKKLLCLNLKSCTELNRLPAELGGLEALKEILIDGTSVEEIPLKGYSKELETLSASNCLSLSLLIGVGELAKLRRLSLRNCRRIRKLPESIGQPGSPLEELDISGTGISKLPDSFGNLQRLRVLKMDYCFIRDFPISIWLLQSLEEIHASSCRNLKGGIPGDIGKLENLRILRLRNSAISSLPPEIKRLSKLERLDVLHCDKLSGLPELPSGLAIHPSVKLKEMDPDRSCPDMKLGTGKPDPVNKFWKRPFPAPSLAVCNYQVFLSFRGPDVHHNFLECFYDHLRGSGIAPFMDKEEIEYSERIEDEIVEAIKRSDICIPVLSENFASSAACLMEVAQMVESKKTILPIFYGVKPGVVRLQQGTYEESFVKHKSRRDAETITKWKTALASIAGIKGFELEDVENGYLELLNNVVYRLWQQILRQDEQVVTKNLVGMDGDVQEMMRKLGVNNQDGRVIEGQKMTGSCVVAIHGLPGVGKTTLAKVVYNKISHLFDVCSFLENVRGEIEQKRLMSLQEKLIRDLRRGNCPEVKSSNEGTKRIKLGFRTKRVLIVLDDVDEFGQIKPLAEQLTWFGPGSRMILTTRRKDIIKHYDPREINEHEVLPMNERNALKLFNWHAFRLEHSPEGYDSLPSNITSATGNLPLAIESVGSSLYGTSKEIWTETLERLRSEPEGGVERVLMASYDLLKKSTKEIFLDIACFFIGVEKKIPCYMWDARKLFPNTGVDQLQNISFLKIGEENEFWMHDQLKILGREIVKKENYENPGKRSRLWDYKDVQTTLREKKGTDKVVALHVNPNFSEGESEIVCFHSEEFHHLPNLRFLKLDHVDIEGNPENLLLSNLIWLDWHGCRDKSKLFALNMKKLVILDLCSSPVELNLEDWKQLMLKAGSLKVLNLKGCPLIFASLEFPASMPLECLILEDCLLVIPTNPESTSSLANLVSLNMKHCKYFKHLPQALCSLKALKELLIDGTDVERLHFEEGSLPALEILSACECKALGEVTDSIGLLKNLRKLTLRGCKVLRELPPVIGKLVLLQEIDLSDTLIMELPSSVKDLKNLKVLKMVHTYLEEFPEAIKDLKKLKELDFTHCGSLSGLCDITRLFSLRILRLKCTSISCVRARDYKQYSLYILELEDSVFKDTV